MNVVSHNVTLIVIRAWKTWLVCQYLHNSLFAFDTKIIIEIIQTLKKLFKQILSIFFTLGSMDKDAFLLLSTLFLLWLSHVNDSIHFSTAAFMFFLWTSKVFFLCISSTLLNTDFTSFEVEFPDVLTSHSYSIEYHSWPLLHQNYCRVKHIVIVTKNILFQPLEAFKMCEICHLRTCSHCV